MSTDSTPALRDTTPAHTPTDPTGSRLMAWADGLGAAHRIATALCTTLFVPTHFRGKPEEAAAAILYGDEIGLTPTQALQSLYVIGGKPAMYARPMVALAQGAGHEVWTEEKSDESVTVCGRRKGSTHVTRETWTNARAEQAGYTSNRKYKTDPQAMLYARAASDVCRQVAADVLSGIGYSVEEMQLSGSTIEHGGGAEQPRAVTAAAFAKAQPDPEPDPPTDDVHDAEVVPDEPGQALEEVDPLQSRTRGHLFALFQSKGIAEADQLPGIIHVTGRHITSRAQITQTEALQVIEVLKGRPDVGVDASEPEGGEQP